MFLLNASAMRKMQHRVSFWAEVKRYEFKTFLLLDWLPLISWQTVVNSKAPFSVATTPRCRVGCYSFPWIASLTLDPYLIMLSVKHGGIKYCLLSLWYDSTRVWIPVSQTSGEHSNHYVNGPVDLPRLKSSVYP